MATGDYVAVLADLRERRGHLQIELHKLDTAITALEDMVEPAPRGAGEPRKQRPGLHALRDRSAEQDNPDKRVAAIRDVKSAILEYGAAGEPALHKRTGVGRKYLATLLPAMVKDGLLKAEGVKRIKYALAGQPARGGLQ